MTFTLTETFDDRFKYEDQVFHVDMSFDNILRLFEMFDDDDLQPVEKIFLGIEILLCEYEKLQGRSFEELNALFEYTLKEFLEINMKDPPEQQKKVMDFKKDAELIYASFRAVYNMDLFEWHGNLHWNKFQALLMHLNDESPFKKAVGYRNAKVPQLNNHNKEHVEHIQQMKRVYALEQSEEEKEKQINNTFDTLAQTFKGGEVKRNE